MHAAYADADFDSGPEAITAAKTYAGALEPHMHAIKGRHAAVDVGAGTGAGRVLSQITRVRFSYFLCSGENETRRYPDVG